MSHVSEITLLPVVVYLSSLLWRLTAETWIMQVAVHVANIGYLIAS